MLDQRNHVDPTQLGYFGTRFRVLQTT
jgi:hypothetical protein